MRLRHFSVVVAIVAGLLARSGDEYPIYAAEDPATTTEAAADADSADDRDVVPLPGLWASYRVGDDVLVERFEPAPAFALEAGQSPDLRLPVEGWTVRWAGLLDVQQPGAYHFSALTSGSLIIRIDGRVVLEMPGPAKAAEAQGSLDASYKLDVGYHSVVFEFAPDGPGAGLEIWWQSDTLARERIPEFALVHSPEVHQGADLFLIGRLAIEEHSCVACHQADSKPPLAQLIGQRRGPKLVEAGLRLNAGWIYHWLGDPQAWRAGSVMPKVFSDDRQGEVERYAVAKVLAALEGDDKPALKPAVDGAPSAEQVAAGKRLYERVGCMACHDAEPGVAKPAPLALHDLGKKHSVEKLAAYLADPGANDPCARMPAMGLSGDECRALAAYLSSRDVDGAPAFELPAPPTSDEVTVALAKVPGATRPVDAPASLDEQVAELGRRVLSTRRCANCHDLPASLGGATDAGAPDRLAPTPAARSLAEIASGPAGGCLAVGNASGDAPRFGQSLNRTAARQFLSAAISAPGTADPAQQARLAIVRFRCTVCHERDGQGGLSADLYTQLTANQTDAEAELVRPPSLTGVARKLHTAALAGVLAGDERSRPWMALRMPRFGKQDMEALVGQLTAADATLVDALGDQVAAVSRPSPAATTLPADTALVEAGRTLIGSRGFGCIKCHDVRGIPSGGTRGPDLARITRRVRNDWFNHWMADPQRLEPGTRMPTVFLAGKSPYAEILEGDPARQRDAMWAYLSAGDELTLPEGIEAPGAVVTAGPMLQGRPWVLRTFLPELSPRSLAIHFGGDVHAAFDAQNCRLAYAWQGDFVDLAASWTHRGGREASLFGKVIWKSPAGFPWAISLDKSPATPDFAAQAADLSLGAPAPHGAPPPTLRLHFLGYRLPPRGGPSVAGPTLRYELELPEGQRAKFSETVSPLTTRDANGLLREIDIQAPPSATALLHCAAVGSAVNKPAESSTAKASQLPTVTLVDESGAVVLSVRAAPAATRWFDSAGRPETVLAIPCDRADGTARLSLAILRAKDASPAGIERVVKAESQLRRPAP
ncbi:MAG: c-type cytochrome [Pirellulales bacterium]|nr:c-type cytochrome [Pirellulales bacterium]